MRSNFGVKQFGDFCICGQNWQIKVKKIDFWPFRLRYACRICVTCTFFTRQNMLLLMRSNFEVNEVGALCIYGPNCLKKSQKNRFLVLTTLKLSIRTHFSPRHNLLLPMRSNLRTLLFSIHQNHNNNFFCRVLGVYSQSDFQFDRPQCGTFKTM